MGAWIGHVWDIGRWMLPLMVVLMLGLRALVRRSTDPSLPPHGKLLAKAGLPMVLADAVAFVLVFATVLYWLGEGALGYLAAFFAGVVLSPLQILGKLEARARAAGSKEGASQ